MINLRQLTFPLVLILILSACKQDAMDGFEKINLLDQGVPVSLFAPVSPEIKTMSYGNIKDITIAKGEDYNVQILYSSTNNLDVNSLKAQHLETTKGGRNFEELISEDLSGYIYKYKFTEEQSFYAFKKVKVIGDHEVLFQSGMASQFELSDIEAMYKAVGE